MAKKSIYWGVVWEQPKGLNTEQSVMSLHLFAPMPPSLLSLLFPLFSFKWNSSYLLLSFGKREDLPYVTIIRCIMMSHHDNSFIFEKRSAHSLILFFLLHGESPCWALSSYHGPLTRKMSIGGESRLWTYFIPWTWTGDIFKNLHLGSMFELSHNHFIAICCYSLIAPHALNWHLSAFRSKPHLNFPIAIDFIKIPTPPTHVASQKAFSDITFSTTNKAKPQLHTTNKAKPQLH